MSSTTAAAICGVRCHQNKRGPKVPVGDSPTAVHCWCMGSQQPFRKRHSPSGTGPSRPKPVVSQQLRGVLIPLHRRIFCDLRSFYHSFVSAFRFPAMISRFIRRREQQPGVDPDQPPQRVAKPEIQPFECGESQTTALSGGGGDCDQGGSNPIAKKNCQNCVKIAKKCPLTLRLISMSRIHTAGKGHQQARKLDKPKAIVKKMQGIAGSCGKLGGIAVLLPALSDVRCGPMGRVSGSAPVDHRTIPKANPGYQTLQKVTKRQMLSVALCGSAQQAWHRWAVLHRARGVWAMDSVAAA